MFKYILKINSKVINLFFYIKIKLLKKYIFWNFFIKLQNTLLIKFYFYLITFCYLFIIKIDSKIKQIKQL